MIRTRIRFIHLTGLWPALLACVIACNPDEAVNAGPPDPPDPPDPPVNVQPGFSILTLLHGTQSGAADHVRDVAIDAQGNVYVAGGTADRGFPTTASAYQQTFGRGMSPTSTGGEGNWDVFVMKFSPNGQLVWSTLLGGGNYDRAYAIEVDGSGVYVAGRAGDGFPTTAGVIQPSFAGDNIVSPAYGRQDGFIAKVSLDGSTLLWSTYFGGPADEFIRDLAVDANGDLYPGVAIGKQVFQYITPGAFQPANRGQSDGIACRIAAGATSVRWCTFLGGSGADGFGPSVRVDGAGNLYFLMQTASSNAPTTAGAYQTSLRGGSDVLLAKFSPQGGLLFSTYFGGTGNETIETHSLWVNAAGESFIGAMTTSSDLPTTPGAWHVLAPGGASDGFIARISFDGGQLLASTYLGGAGRDEVEGIGMDGAGNVVVTGNTGGGFPGSSGAPQPAAAGDLDGFIAVLPPSLTSPIRATFVGGSGEDRGRTVAVDVPRNVIYTGGYTESSNFPTIRSAFLSQYGGRDAFVAGWRFQ